MARDITVTPQPVRTTGTDEANSLIRLAVRLHKKLKDQMKADEAIFNQEYEAIPNRKHYKPVKTVTAKAAALNIANAVTHKLPDITCHPRSDEDAAVADAETNSNFLSTFWGHAQSNKKRPVLRDAALFGIVRGAFIFKTTLDQKALRDQPTEPDKPSMSEADLVNNPSVLEQLPEEDLLAIMADNMRYKLEKEAFDNKKRSWQEKYGNKVLINVQARDPKFVYWDPVEEDPEWVIEIYPRAWYDVKRQWKSKLGDFRPSGTSPLPGFQDSETVWFTEIWKQDKYWFGVSNDASHNFVPVQGWTKHPYGFIPYAITGALTSPFHELERQYESIYAGYHDLLNYEYRLKNQVAEYIQKVTQANIVAKMNTPEPIDEALETGTILQLGPTDSIDYLEPGGGQYQILSDMEESVRGELSGRLMVPEVLLGRTRSRSGYGTQVQAQLASQTLLPFTTGLSLAVQKCNEHIMRLVELLPGKTYVWGKWNEYGEAFASKSTIRGFYQNDVEVGIELPSEKAQNSQNEINLWKAGLKSKRAAAKDAGVRNPRKEQLLWMAEQVQQSPQFIQAMGMVAAREIFKIPFPDEIAAAEGQGAPEEKGPPGGMAMPGPEGQPGLYPQAPPGSPAEAQMMQQQAMQPNQGAKKQPMRRR